MEYLDVLDEKGNKTGVSKPYSEVHRLGLLHRTVHVWFINSRGQLLLQKRSANKRAYPNLWDISAAGHISAGETSLEAAKKETEEELGLSLPDSTFNFLFEVRQPRAVLDDTFIDDEFNDVYLVHMDVPVSKLSVPPDEVAEVKWVDSNELKDWVRKGKGIVPHQEEYERLFAYLKKYST